MAWFCCNALGLEAEQAPEDARALGAGQQLHDAADGATQRVFRR